MEAPFKNGGYFAATTTTTSTASLAIIIGKYHSGTFTGPSNVQGLLSPSTAEKYDLTYDDGDPETGNVIATEGSNFSAGDCVTSGEYNSLNEDEACILHIVMIE